MSARVLPAVALFALVGCTHAPVSANRKYATAPRVENPLTSPVRARTPGLTGENELFSLASFDGQALCFDGSNTQSPAEATATRYTLRFLNTDEVDLKNSPSLKVSQVRVLKSDSQLVPVTKTVQDTVRDSRGNTVATVSRQVQELETHYQTQLAVCFPGVPQVLTTEARFMVMLREGSTASTWGIPMRARSSWVWRFPAADNVSPSPVASR